MASKQELYLRDRVVNGGKHTKGQSAEMAGYSKAVAKSPQQKIEKTKSFQQLLTRYCPDEMLQQKLIEGLNSNKVLINNKGEITGEIPDNSNRLKALDIALKLKNCYPKDKAIEQNFTLSNWLNSIRLQEKIDQREQVDNNLKNLAVEIESC